MVLSAATSCGRFADAVGTGECPEWQRELTVNQPSYDFAGSSPASPTSLRSLRELRLGKPAQLFRSEASEGCLAEARQGIHTTRPSTHDAVSRSPAPSLVIRSSAALLHLESHVPGDGF